MIATAGKNEVALEGKCLENAMKVGLFDASGKLIDEKDTKGNLKHTEGDLGCPFKYRWKSRRDLYSEICNYRYVYG